MCPGPHHNLGRGWRRETDFSLSVKYFTDRSKAVLTLWIICVFFLSCVSRAFASVHCFLVVTCWQRAALLALVGDMHCIFVTFPHGILGQVWYFIVSFPVFAVFLTLNIQSKLYKTNKK